MGLRLTGPHELHPPHRAGRGRPEAPIATTDEANSDRFGANWDSCDASVRAAIGRFNTHAYGNNGRT
ncbi:hypothetical protein [Streptomyces sp. BE133]|uniref:hypothetical protein n=1 Tax=Streptomyces sp. BE133 TaxID=3002523 RepID=UPI002E7695A4|nr:hypothetical protein [Streptomyces sp. BE133]MEE1805253.1 hypothetical protein [Streptomyces sp. BE133]